MFFKDVGEQITSALVNQTVPPIIGQVIFAFRTGENVDGLHSAAEALLAWKKDVEKRIQLDTLKGGEATNEVRQWMNQVEVVVEKEVREIEERYERRSCQCFGGYSLNCYSNYVISKDAYKKHLEVQALHDRGKFERVTLDKLPPPVQILSIPLTTASTENANLQLAHDYINDDDARIIGIWGMGGVGKTHFLKQINNSFSGSSFEHVIFVTASRECSVEIIQRRIAKGLNLPLNDFDDIESRANEIFNFLDKRNFLVLLDDLWERIDLRKVGIPFTLGSRQKVIFTTRSNRVCGEMETNKTIKVDCLNEEDAWNLFEEKVGLETINADPNIPSLARELVRELDGLPLALIVIGRAMYGKKDSRIWERDLQLLKESRFPEVDEIINEESLFDILKFSYDNLRTDTLRQCFLTCSLWPEDFEIDKEELIQRWMGLGIIQEHAFQQEFYNPGYALIHELQATCLLEACRNPDRVVMHDVIRDMAVWIACDYGKNRTKLVVRKGTSDSLLQQEEDIWCDAEYIALSGDLSSKSRNVVIPSVASRTNLKVLILYWLSIEDINEIYHHPGLTFLDLQGSGLKCFPAIICELVNLRYLNLSKNLMDNHSLPENVKLLTKLRYLILRNCGISEVPDGVISELKELIMLDLFIQDPLDIPELESRGFSSFFFKDLASLKNIKALGINVSNNDELQSLSDLVNVSLRSLSIDNVNNNLDSLLITPSIFGNIKIQKSLVELVITGKENSIHVVFENKQVDTDWQLQNLKSLEFSNMHAEFEIFYRGVTPKDLFPKLTHLKFYTPLAKKNLSWTLYLPCVDTLVIENSCYDELFTIEGASSSGNAEIREVRQTFPSLESLYLNRLSNLKSICSSHITFPSLKLLLVLSCPHLRKLPFKRNTIPGGLFIRGGQRWWDQLEWEDDQVKSSLQSSFDSRYFGE